MTPANKTPALATPPLPAPGGATTPAGTANGPATTERVKARSRWALQGKLVSAEKLLEELFDPDARPSLRWLREQTRAKAIPHVRIGRFVFFDVEMVRTALATRNLVRHRMKKVG